MASVLLAGPEGTVRDLVATVLSVHRVTVQTAPAALGDVDLLLLVSPGSRDWALAAGAAAVVLMAERELSPDEACQAVLAGADAILHPNVSPDTLVAAVTTVAAGGTVLDPTLTRRLATAARETRGAGPGDISLTGREQSILESADQGDSVKQTARSLGIAAKTVENLQSRMFRKLGARNRAHAVALAHQLGLLGRETAA